MPVCRDGSHNFSGPVTRDEVLGAAASGGPGPLVSHFVGIAGQLPCPVYVIPGSISDADLERLG